MVKPDELWIGDVLIHRKTGKKGTFEGLKENGKIRLKRDGKIFLYTPESLDPWIEKKEKTWKPKEENKDAKIVFDDYSSIDLHIEILNPRYIHALPERILDIQTSTFELFLEEIIRNRIFKTTIIHGKGTGTLKEHILSYLKTTKEVDRFISVNDGGATEVYFEY